MYIKRSPLGRGNLSFGKKRKRFPFFWVGLYGIVLLFVAYIFLRKDTLQPQVLAMLGPTPMPTVAPAALLVMAEEAYYEGDLEDAAAYYAQLVELEPENLDYRFNQARMLTLTHDEEILIQVLELSEEMILLAPEDPRGHVIKSRAHDWMGDYDEAVFAALQAIEHDPESALAHSYLGEAYTDLGRFRQAREQLELALELDPYSVDSRRNYAYLLEFYGDYEGAIQQYQQALQLHENLLDLWYGLARNYRGAGKIDESVDTYSKIILKTPDDPLPYIELGRTYFEIRDDAAAQESFSTALGFYDREEDAIEKDFYYMRTLIRLGMVYFTRRNYEDAIETFETAITWSNENGVEVPLEAYYVTSSGYYYLDVCRDDPNDEWKTGAVDRAVEAFNLYHEREIEDDVAMVNILRIFVLCRDYSNESYTHSGADFANGFPVGYDEPCVIVTRPGAEDNDEDRDEDDPCN